MTSLFVRRPVGAFLVAALAAGVSWGAEDTTSRAQSGKSASSAGGSTSGQRPAARSGAKGPLPDPALLDGSTLPAEKKSEHGMIGDFELPGDENARNGKVGGPQNPNASAGGQSNNTPMGMPQGAGGQQGQQQGQQQQGGGAAGAQAAQSGQQQQGGGAQAGGPQNPSAAGQQVAGGGDPGAQAQGIQVAELAGEASGQSGAGAAGLEEKPKQVAIGDSAMRIEQSASAAGVVGAQQQQVAGQTQQHEKGTGSGGKGAGGAGGGNRVEKGRVIPAGL